MSTLVTTVTFFKTYFKHSIGEAIAEHSSGYAVSPHYVEQQKKIRRAQASLNAEGIEPTVENVYRRVNGLDGKGMADDELDEDDVKSKDGRDRSKLSRQAVLDNLEKMDGRHIISIEADTTAEIAAQIDGPDTALLKKESRELMRKFIMDNLTHDEIMLALELEKRGCPINAEKKKEIADALGIPNLDAYNRIRNSTIRKLAEAARTGRYGEDIKRRFGKVVKPADAIELIDDASYDNAVDSQLDSIMEIDLDITSLSGEQRIRTCYERTEHTSDSIVSVRTNSESSFRNSGEDLAIG